jgi:hypothetical protein
MRVEDNGPIHTSKRALDALTARAHWLTVEWLPKYAPNSTISSSSGATFDLNRERIPHPLAKPRIFA